ncbi:hypothetical protein LIER_03361 [Lithospermum erythrorhizon]|uniref:Uncharacterized protein n=1 Tax=Lithospermum erythrorhizon TaxID=34254 RepID=A0AAV3NSV5_LITER
MGGKSLKVDKFTGRNSFSLWQIKVRALLKREASLPPLYDNFRESLTNGKDILSLEKVRSGLHTRELLHTCSGPISDNQVVRLVANINQGRDWFSTYEQFDGGNISMTNRSVCKVVEMGSIKIRTHDCRFYTLNEFTIMSMRGKLEPRAKKRIFVSYGDGVKGYRIWSPYEMRVILSRNVAFDENSMFNPIVKSTTSEEGGVEKQRC